MSRAITCALTLCAVDKGDIVPQLVIDNAVFKLCVSTPNKSVCFADFHGCTTSIARVAERFRVLCSCRNMDWRRPVALIDAPEPDVVGTAVTDNGVAGCCLADLQCHEGEDEFEKHDSRGVMNGGKECVIVLCSLSLVK